MIRITILLIYCFATLLLPERAWAQTSNQPPVLQATGDQLYCPGTTLPIVNSISISDPDDTHAQAIYIQISEGYEAGRDLLSLSGIHSQIVSSWDAAAGKLTLTGIGGAAVSYSDFIAAIEDVVYSNNQAAPTGVRTFSITTGSANYLPSTGHYYQFVPSLGITWSDARLLAEASTYYGLQGYLATIGSPDEAQLSGEQASGAGWIGGSDAETEGVWKWVTGPEAGTVFWNGGVTGWSPNFAFWNTGEPNNAGNENYAHVTAPGVGIPGSWNDLSNVGGSSGDYQPKGYIVEYGGMPGDPVLNISTSSKISMARISATTGATRCGPGTVVLSATAAAGTVRWYDNATGGSLLYTGNDFTTPFLNSSQTFYADAADPGCTATRTAVTAEVNEIPVVTASAVAPACEGSFTLSASSTAGQIKWYATQTGEESLLGTGPVYTTAVLTETTVFYVGAINNGCESAARVMVTATVLAKPVVSDERVEFCIPGVATLDAGVPNATYVWDDPLHTARTRQVREPGVYSVEIINADGCSATKTFTVVGYKKPQISDVAVTGTEVIINTTEAGDFEYSIDGLSYQNEPLFEVLTPGLHRAYVKERHECGFDVREFVVIITPQFFTPNGDGHNDLWSVGGMFFLPSARLSIFDRFGKLLAEINRGNPAWDGTYKGSPLPSGDYWYVFNMGGTTATTRGHFSLVR